MTFLTKLSSSTGDLSTKLLDYVQLTKPRLILLFLITTAAAMEVASQGRVAPQLLLMTLVSGACAAAAANTLNCLYDRDIDAIMERTRHRPLPAGRVAPWEAVLLAVLLATTAFGLLVVFANLLSACLAMAGIAVYVGVYTHWLKRSSPQNIVIGGAAGAIPPLVGWAAVTGELSWAAWVLFAIIFIWTPPHFWPLAMLIQEDYARVRVPMLPVVDGDRVTAQQIFLYTLALVPTSLLLIYPCGVVGWGYGVGAIALGGWFIYYAWQLTQAPEDKERARNLFKFSILYMMLLCGAMVGDRILLPQLSESLNALACFLG